MSVSLPISLFSAYGVELEYMIVDRDTLSIMPAADRLIHSVCGAYESEIECGPLCWSNELVSHVIELKTNGPTPALDGLAKTFQVDVNNINERLAPMNARLMPTAMHPWMNPDTETHLWPHEYNPVYETYNRIFDCRGHGWSNLQSTHLNLPFAGDAEFAKLHAAIRVLLPIIPALTAASPIQNAEPSKWLDTRMEYYRTNSSRIPSISGKIIPEPAFSEAEYCKTIFEPMYRDIAPFDPDGILQYEWLNARGAIARFDRNTIEIRVLDIQECPLADIAILTLLDAVLKALIEERWCSLERQQAASVDPLVEILLQTMQKAGEAKISDPTYLGLFGYTAHSECTAEALWTYLYEQTASSITGHDDSAAALETILENGCLSRRMLQNINGDWRKERIYELYAELCDCLAQSRLFLP